MGISADSRLLVFYRILFAPLRLCARRLPPPTDLARPPPPLRSRGGPKINVEMVHLILYIRTLPPRPCSLATDFIQPRRYRNPDGERPRSRCARLPPQPRQIGVSDADDPSRAPTKGVGGLGALGILGLWRHGAAGTTTPRAPDGAVGTFVPMDEGQKSSACASAVNLCLTRYLPETPPAQHEKGKSFVPKIVFSHGRTKAQKAQNQPRNYLPPRRRPQRRAYTLHSEFPIPHS